MFEKVNPSHPDKICDRIAGALVDLAYAKQENPTVAVEVLLGHGTCTIIAESSYNFTEDEVLPIVTRISRQRLKLNLISVPQDTHLADNQKDAIKCGDNGIFKGEPLTPEEIKLSEIAHTIYERYPFDGKYVLDEKTNTLIVCQSGCATEELTSWLKSEYPEYNLIVNPLGDWTGGPDVDTGAVNRKLGSDMARSVTGGGINGKDLSKADVSVNIYAFLEAQKTNKSQELFCAIGDEKVNNISYSEILTAAKKYVNLCGGFEKLAEWGLV